MKKLTGVGVGLCLLFSGVSIAAAQAKMDDGPPKVLVIQREFVKPGKTGAVHVKSESAFIKAMSDAKWPTHYIAADSLSGPSRSLFITGYDSLEAWEKDTWNLQKNATLAAAIDNASLADGALLSSYDSGTFAYRPEYSHIGKRSIAEMRYMEIARFVIKPGHEHDWDTLAKMYASEYPKSVPDADWAVFESVYGTDNGGVFLIISPRKSLAEVDKSFGADATFMAALGASGMQKLSELSAACIRSTANNLFAFNPKMSYPSDEWIKIDPFWKPAQ